MGIKKKNLLIVLLVLIALIAVLLVERHYRVQRVTYRMDPNRDSVRVGVDIFTGFAPVHLGVVTGLFERHGLRVTPIVLRTTAERRAALFRGDVDAICASVSELTLAWSQHARAVIVSGIDESYGADGIVAREEIRSIRDLQGKRIGLETGTPSHFFLIYLLDQHGLSLDDVELVKGDVSSVGPAFVGGDLDAVVTWDPMLYELASRKNAHLLASTQQYPGVIVDVLAFRPEFLVQNPDSVTRFLEGWFDTVEYLKANPRESNRMMASWMRQDPEEFNRLLGGIRFSDFEHTMELFGPTERRGRLANLIQSTSELWLDSQNIDFALQPEQILEERFVRDMASRR